MALTESSVGHVHVYLVSIRIDTSDPSTEFGRTYDYKKRRISEQLKHDQRDFPHIYRFKVSPCLMPTTEYIPSGRSPRGIYSVVGIKHGLTILAPGFGARVCGEPLILAIYQVPVEKLKRFEQSMANFYRYVRTSCEVLTSYETFANETLGVPETLTRRESDDYIAGLSPLLWCQYTLNFKEKPVEVLREAWRKEATMFLENRMDVKLEIYKVVGQPKVHAFVSMTPQEWDQFAFKLPTNEADAGALTGVVKVVRDLDF